MDVWCDPSAWLVFVAMFGAAGAGGGLAGLAAFHWLMLPIMTASQDAVGSPCPVCEARRKTHI